VTTEGAEEDRKRGLGARSHAYRPENRFQPSVLLKTVAALLELPSPDAALRVLPRSARGGVPASMSRAQQAPEGPPVVAGPRAMLVEPGPGDAGIEAREFVERAGDTISMNSAAEARSQSPTGTPKPRLGARRTWGGTRSRIARRRRTLLETS